MVPRAGTTQFSGFTLSDGRRGGFVWDQKPRCINGHRLRVRDTVLTEAITTCQHRPERGALACGAQLYVALLTAGGSAAVQGTGERVWLVVEITPDHVMRMRREPMIFLERMKILGVVLPGVDIDLGLSLERPA